MLLTNTLAADSFLAIQACVHVTPWFEEELNASQDKVGLVNCYYGSQDLRCKVKMHVMAPAFHWFAEIRIS